MPVGCERFEKLVGGPLFIANHAGDVLHVTAVLEKRISARG